MEKIGVAAPGAGRLICVSENLISEVNLAIFRGSVNKKMARVNKTAVKQKLEEWAAVQKRISAADDAKNKKLAPIVEAHNEEIKPILENFDKKAAPLRERAAELEAEIKAMVEANRDEAGNPVPVMVSSDKATAAVEKKEGARVIDVGRYFDLVKVKTAEFWATVSVKIAGAEKLLGKNAVDEISDKRESYTTTLRLN